MLIRVTLIVIAALLITACADEASDADLVRAYIAAYNEHDIAGMFEHLHDDIQWGFLDGDMKRAEAVGKEQLAASLRSYFESLPSARSEIESIGTEGTNLAVVERAVWEDDGETRSQCGRAIYEFEDELIVGVWYVASVTCEHTEPARKPTP